jgi:2-polyprenyl-6-hydroxyphenyl methylase/3-demethylubiquinone-9 3-methyltransferase
VKAVMLNLRKNGYLKIEGIVADATALPFRENCFDFIMCIDVIEHVKEDFKLLFEARRVLRNHGNFVVATQNSRSLNYIIEAPLQRYIIGNRRWMGWDSTHLRFYTPKSLVSLLMNSGFSVIKVAGTYFVPFMLATRIKVIYLLMKLMNKILRKQPMHSGRYLAGVSSY